MVNRDIKHDIITPYLTGSSLIKTIITFRANKYDCCSYKFLPMTNATPSEMITVQLTIIVVGITTTIKTSVCVESIQVSEEFVILIVS